MNDATINRIRIAKGNFYWVNFAGEIRPAKVLAVFEQQGYKMVRSRVGWPIFGHYTVESLAQFYGRMVKV